MLIRCGSFLGGAYSLGYFRTLPEDDLFLTFVLIAVITLRSRKFATAGWFLFGFVTMWTAAWANLGDRLDERMQAYSGVLNEFGCPGNTVDHWRVQFVGRESSPKAANGKS